MWAGVSIQGESRAQGLHLGGTRPALVLLGSSRWAGWGGRSRALHVGTGAFQDSCFPSSESSHLLLDAQNLLQGCEPSSAQ